ncbi:MAG TPA: ATP synthase F1 subunit gamma [Anaerolineae bacterium]|nr:ATP synthase F1 subunit gamma [Anaerolineae bacterium]HIQ05003.1 ATP synthase F1 subunit gamma [Anaerolineae bacterium]
MATAREIKRRIRSVKNISQVTRAMEAVAASKMRKAQAQVLASRPYAEHAWDVLTHLTTLRRSRADLQPLLQIRPVRRIGLVLITADRGLAGGLNGNMIREAVRYIRHWQDQGLEVQLVTVGRKGRDWMRRYGPRIRAEFDNPGDHPTAADITPITRVVIDDFASEAFDAYYVGYTSFINTIIQRPVVRKILPIEPSEPTKVMAPDYIFEPDAQTILEQVLRGFTEWQILQAIYEALASEHSARMVAMRNATEAAYDLINDLTLRYNKVRQEAITKEILDIANGAEALAQARGG